MQLHNNSLNTNYTHKRLDEFLQTHKTDLLIEALSVEQLQDYIGWFGEIRKFIGQHPVPTLKSATDNAYNDLTKLFGGDGSLKKRITNVLGGSKLEQQKLNNVNKFLWGITTVIGMLPTIITTVNQQIDNKLLSVEDKNLPFAKCIVAASLDVKKSTAAIKKFQELVLNAFSISTKQFGISGVPYIKNPKQVIKELLEMTLTDILSLGKDANALQKLWISKMKSMQTTAKTLDNVADGNGEQTNGTTDNVAVDLSKKSVKRNVQKLVKIIDDVSKITQSGRKPSPEQQAILNKYNDLIKQFA